MCARSWIRLENGDVTKATELIDSACQISTVGFDAEDLALAIQILIGVKRFSQAIEFLERVVHPELFDANAQKLLFCAQELQRHDLSMRICRSLRESGTNEDKLFRLEVDLLELYSPEKALEVVQDVLTRAKAPKYFIAYQNYLLTRLQRRDGLQLSPESLPLASEVTVGKFRLLLLPWHTHGMFRECLDFLYQQVRSFFESSLAHKHYVSNFLEYSNSVSLEVLQVKNGISVLLDYGNGKHEWFTIEDEKPIASRHEFSSQSEKAIQLLGKKLGDEIDLPGFFQPSHKAKIIDLQSNLTRMFQDCLTHYSTRFPEDLFLQGFSLGSGAEPDVTPIIESLKERRSHFEHCLRLYREHPVPIYQLASNLEISEFEAITTLSTYDDCYIRCNQATPEDLDRAVSRMTPKPDIVIDTSAIVSIHRLGLWDLLQDAFSPLVSRSTIECLQEWVAEAKSGLKQKGGFVQIDDNDRLIVSASNQTAKEARFQVFESILNETSRCCVAQSSENVAAIEPQKRKIYSETLGYHNLETLQLAKDNQALIWTDDFVMSLVAKSDFNCERIWTQVFLLWAKENGKLAPARFDEASAMLVGWKYSNTIWNANDFIAAGALAAWDVHSTPFKQYFETLRRQSSQGRSFPSFVVNILVVLKNSSCGQFQESAIIQALLRSIGNRGTASAVLRMIASAFGVDVIAAIRFRSEIQFWLNNSIGN